MKTIIGHIDDLELDVRVNNMPIHFHVTKPDKFCAFLTVEPVEVLGYDWQTDGAKLSARELAKIKSWLAEPYEADTSITNQKHLLMSWKALNPMQY